MHWPARRSLNSYPVCYTLSRRTGGSSMAEQNFANHAKLFPPFHFFVVPVLLVNFVWSIYRLKTWAYSFDGFLNVAVAAALILGFFSARRFALMVQDRVIRLEERLRYQRLLPADL